MRIAEFLPGRTLRGRLIASYVIVLAVTLIGVLIALSVLLPDYRGREADERLVGLARPTLRLMVELAARGATTDEIRAALDDQAEATGLRMLVLGRNGVILSDTAEDDSLQGRPFVLPVPAAGPTPPRPMVVRDRFFAPDKTMYRYVGLPIPASGRPRGEAAWLLLAQPERGWADLWSDLGCAPGAGRRHRAGGGPGRRDAGGALALPADRPPDGGLGGDGARAIRPAGAGRRAGRVGGADQVVQPDGRRGAGLAPDDAGVRRQRLARATHAADLDPRLRRGALRRHRQRRGRPPPLAGGDRRRPAPAPAARRRPARPVADRIGPGRVAA